jgi:hypothetical protein
MASLAIISQLEGAILHGLQQPKMAGRQWRATILLCSKLIQNHLFDWGLRQQPLLCSICLDPAKTNQLNGYLQRNPYGTQNS